MPGTEALSVLRNVLLDAHLGITKPHDGDLTIFLGQHRGLFGRTWRSLGLVVPSEFLASVGDHLAFGKTYHPAGSVTRLGPESLPSLSNA